VEGRLTAQSARTRQGEGPVARGDGGGRRLLLARAPRGAVPLRRCGPAPPYRGPPAPSPGRGSGWRCRSVAHRLEQDGRPCRGSRSAPRRVARMAHFVESPGHPTTSRGGHPATGSFRRHHLLFRPPHDADSRLTHPSGMAWHVRVASLPASFSRTHVARPTRWSSEINIR